MISDVAVLETVRRILIVEDDPGVASVIAGLFETAVKSPPVIAGHGNAALDLLRRGQEFDLITTDLLMPGGNGSDFVKGARALGCLRPILVISSSIDASTMGHLEHLSPIEFLDKPFLSDGLFSRAAAVLRESAQLQGALVKHTETLATSIETAARLRDELAQAVKSLKRRT